MIGNLFRRRTRRDWLVWSRAHNAWWRPESRGYTLELAEAGLYTEAEAKARTEPGKDEPRHLSSVRAEIDREIALVQATARSKLRNLARAKAELLTASRGREVGR